MKLEEKQEIIEQCFSRQMALVAADAAREITINLEALDKPTALVLKYLYGTAPLSDIGNYAFAYFLDYARHGVFLMQHCPYQDKIPADIFLPYVLHYRVNEEELALCRSFFYEQLKEQVTGLSMTQAALEVNFWCAGEVAYQCSDERTASAMTVFKTAHGRCGEESVFTVNAMRSIGIPARQVYAPRWSHCDDNHAWVEVWCDRQWHFLGACEPEAVLDKGWFIGASSRAMLVHSRWFALTGQPSKDEMVGKAGMAVLLNQTKRYAPVKQIKVTVTDEAKNPIAGARVRMQVLNYAYFYPVATLYTGTDGQVTMTTGFGSLLIDGEKDGCFGAVLANVYKSESYEIVLKRDGQKNDVNAQGWTEFNFYAPEDAPLYKNTAAPAEKKKAADRLKRLQQQRSEKAKSFANKELSQWLATAKDQEKEIRQSFVGVLTDKDLLDGQTEVLMEHLTHAMPFYQQYPKEIFYRYVATPRVHLEVLDCYRAAIKKWLPAKEQKRFVQDAALLWQWIDENIATIDEAEYDNLITTPIACIKIGVASALSKQILFVAACRTLGLAARLHPLDLSMEVWQDDSFLPLRREEAGKGTLQLAKQQGEDWSYFQNFTLGRWEKNQFITLSLSQLDFEGKKMTVLLKPGLYRLITVNRLPNGNMLGAFKTFSILSDQCREEALYLRSASAGELLEDIHLPDFVLENEAGRSIRAKELTQEEPCVFFFLEEGSEPTEHILNELQELKEAYQKCGARLIFAVRSTAAIKQETLQKCLRQLPQIAVYLADFEELIPILGRGMYVDPDKLPLLIVADAGLQGVYGTSGYNVGTGDMILKILSACLNRGQEER